jgi:hypothetical protein
MKTERGSGVTDFLVFCIFVVICGPTLLYLAFGLAASYEVSHPTPSVQAHSPTVDLPNFSVRFKATYTGDDVSFLKHNEQVIIEEVGYSDLPAGATVASVPCGSLRRGLKYRIYTSARATGFVWCGELPDYFRRTR